MSRVILETPRLLLREMTRRDIDFIALMMAHPEVNHFYERRFSRAESETWLERQLERYRRDGKGLWLAVERETGNPGRTGRARVPGCRRRAPSRNRLAPRSCLLGPRLRD